MTTPLLPYLGWTLDDWLSAYRHSSLDSRNALYQLCDAISTDDNAWIYCATRADIDAQLNALAAIDSVETLPLYGVPFAVKDNIDVAGMPTTAACPAYAYTPTQDAVSVARLKAAGAIVVGKTNLDQFATGLVGTRSPYGAVKNTFNPAYVSGGSSSGSASVVARGVVPFSLGTDTAGSGRVPAGFNNIIGLKPTKGRFSITGVVPACKSLDCVSIFSLTVEDAERVAELMEGFDPADGFSRIPTTYPRYFSAAPRLGIPASPNWFGDAQAEQAWLAALDHYRSLGITLVELDFSPMFELASLLYGGPWVAERYAAIGAFMQGNGDAMNSVVRSIVLQAEKFTAADAYAADYERARLARRIQLLMQDVDALLVPTSPRHPRIDEVNADPVTINSQLGTYTNFVNLANCSAFALPAGMRADGLPFGVTLIAPAWQDAALAEFAKRLHKSSGLPLGALSVPQPSRPNTRECPANFIRIAVVGAHLSGMPLNTQLQERDAVFVESTFTSPSYRFYALPNTTPPKPGLVRVTDSGASIAVELWDVPLVHFGSFVGLIPSPLGIGSVELSDGRTVKGFICEPYALEGATDITHFGGWRAYIASKTASII